MTRIEMIRILEQGSKIIRENNQLECVYCHKTVVIKDKSKLFPECPGCKRSVSLTLGKEATKKLKAIDYDKADKLRWRSSLKSDMAYLKRNKEPFKYLLKSVGLRFNKKEELVNCR